MTAWDRGWSRFARHLRSPNFGSRPLGMPIDAVVLHSISLPPGEYGGTYVHEFFSNRLDWNAHPYFDIIRDMQVSAHFFVARNGELWQFVSCNDRAWHAGVSSYRGRENWNDFSIGIELEGLEGDSFAVAQYGTLSKLLVDITQQYPIDSVVGHEDIAAGRKTDPGSGFDWAHLQRRCGLPEQCFLIRSR